jgi:hypothetical protein
MTRAEFEHVVRAAGAILARDELLVLGSQAVHGSVDGSLPPQAERSVEVDIALPGDVDGRAADLIDGSIGELSMFHETFGYYAHGVEEATAVLPSGWRDRLVRFETPGTNGIVAWCPDPHDLWVSKAIANRPKDIEFCAALLETGLVDESMLRNRLALVDRERLDPSLIDIILARIDGSSG